jgi:viroplasmin and RNaseH domain-containing protein
MAKKTCYAIVKGRKPGIYFEWTGINGAEVQVLGFSGAKYKGFSSTEEAEDWYKKNRDDVPKNNKIQRLLKDSFC